MSSDFKATQPGADQRPIARWVLVSSILASGMAFIDMPQSESCKFKGVSGEFLFWAADVEIDEVDD